MPTYPYTYSYHTYNDSVAVKQRTQWNEKIRKKRCALIPLNIVEVVGVVVFLFTCTHIFVCVFFFVSIRILLSLGHCIMHFVCLLSISWIFNFWLGATIIVSLYTLSRWASFKVFHTKNRIQREKKRRRLSLGQQCQQWTISLLFFLILFSGFGPFRFVFFRAKKFCSISHCPDKRRKETMCSLSFMVVCVSISFFLISLFGN